MKKEDVVKSMEVEITTTEKFSLGGMRGKVVDMRHQMIGVELIVFFQPEEFKKKGLK